MNKRRSPSPAVKNKRARGALSSNHRPYAQGYNGHARCCDCEPCARAYTRAALALWRKFGKAAPLDAARTVFVKAYWRKHPGHLAERPLTRRTLKAAITRITHEE